MSKNHIRSLEFKEHFLFGNLKFEDFKLINFIVGKNNTGKSVLLKELSEKNNTTLIDNFELDIFKFKIQANTEDNSFNIKEDDGLTAFLIYNFHKRVSELMLEKFYTFLRENFDEDIDSLYGQKYPEVYFKAPKTPIPFEQCSKAFRQVVFTLLSFAEWKEGVLLIESPESNLHPDLYVDYAKLLIDLAYELNTQLFIVSYNKDFMNGFVDYHFLNHNISVYRLSKSEADESIVIYDVLCGVLWNHCNYTIFGFTPLE